MRQRKKSSPTFPESRRKNSIKDGIDELQRILPHLGTPENEKVQLSYILKVCTYPYLYPGRIRYHDLIGRIFTHWVNFYYVQSYYKIFRSSPHFCPTFFHRCINFGKIWVGAIFWATFYKLIWSP
jgi:hypothetical protein